MSAFESHPACSVVVPTYNGRALLEVCLAAIERHRPSDPPIEVIVADDASTDDTGDWLSRVHPWVRHVRLEVNQGFCGAANAGIAAARGAIVQLLNNDTEVQPGWIEAGLRPFGDPSVGSVAPLVLVRSDKSRVDSAGDGYAIVGWPFKRGHGETVDDWCERSTDLVFGASGSSAFYRAEALRKVGPYDALYGSYYEDVDLAFRLRWAGYRCVFTSDSVVLHDVSSSYDHAKPKLQRRMSRNAEILFWSNLPTGLLALAGAPHLAFVMLQLAVKFLRGRARPFFEGKLDAVRLVSAIRSRRKIRSDLARSAQGRPHFPMSLVPVREARNHRRRPTERSARTGGVKGAVDL